MEAACLYETLAIARDSTGDKDSEDRHLSSWLSYIVNLNEGTHNKVRSKMCRLQ
jgi:hypothetical protein